MIGGGRIHHHHEFFRFRRHVARAQRFRRQCEAGKDIDLIAHDQLLRQTLGNVRIRTARILADDLDLLAGNGVAMLFDVELDGVVHLRRGVGELARVGHDQSDLDGLLRVRRGCRQTLPLRGRKESFA